ncbi:MAG TPA: response regulator transcription factor [bacterium]|nr:response regulator transcription factor [bacterium]
MIRVFIADDHEIVRSGLKQLLADDSDIRVCGETETALGLPEKARKENWDVLVLDVNMPGNNGPQTVREILAAKPGLTIVLFTMYPEDHHVVTYFRAGALGFLNKRRPIGELADAIRTVSKGKRYITKELAEYLLEHEIDLSKRPEAMLSARELQVVRGLAMGKLSKSVALDMGISQSTVNSYVQRIKIKLGLKSITEIVDYARGNGLLG